MTVKYYNDIVQRSPEWYAARLGLLTASEMKYIITVKKLEYSESKETNSHLYELLAQRMTKYVEPNFQNFDMLRGIDDELDAKRYYEENYAKVTDCGFITNDKWGFTLGYSPDGLVGEDGIIEVKGRKQKFQIETILSGKMPEEFLIQVQTGLLVSERKWCDFISFCGGMPMFTVRILPDEKIQEAIVTAATFFHDKMQAKEHFYEHALYMDKNRLLPTERRPLEQEITSS